MHSQCHPCPVTCVVPKRKPPTHSLSGHAQLPPLSGPGERQPSLRPPRAPFPRLTHSGRIVVRGMFPVSLLAVSVTSSRSIMRSSSWPAGSLLKGWATFRSSICPSMDVGLVPASWLPRMLYESPCPEAGRPGQAVARRLTFLKIMRRLFIPALLGSWRVLSLLVPSCIWRILMARPKSHAACWEHPDDHAGSREHPT